MSLTRKLILRSTILFLSIWLLLVLPCTGYARIPFSNQMKVTVYGRDLILSRHYQEAEVFFKKIVQDWPDELVGYFGLMSLYQVRNLDNFDFRFDPDYKIWEEKGRKLALKIVHDPQSEAWDLLMAGGTLGVSGFYKAHNSRWFSALHSSSLAFHAMEECLVKDPRQLDALLGMGLYHYWRSYWTRKLRFLPFFTDRREEGKIELMRAYHQSEFASALAEIALVFIQFQEKQYQKVLDTTDLLLKRYPQNTILKMLRGKSLFLMKKYPEAIKEFESILFIDPSLSKSYLFKAVAFKELKKFPKR